LENSCQAVDYPIFENNGKYTASYFSAEDDNQEGDINSQHDGVFKDGSNEAKNGNKNDQHSHSDEQDGRISEEPGAFPVERQGDEVCNTAISDQPYAQPYQEQACQQKYYVVDNDDDLGTLSSTPNSHFV
jgi:hypothetical protein